MRRIVIIAAGPAGVSAATRIKRRLPEHEINVIVPASIGEQGAAAGPAARRRAAALPNLEILATREVGVLEAQDIMPDLSEGEITVSSARGSLPVRYTDLVLEVPATVRLPRALQKAENVFVWPMPGFADEPVPCDSALAAAAASGEAVLVVGGGVPSLDAVCLAREAGANVLWLRTGEKESPAVEAQLAGLALRFLGSAVTCLDLPDVSAEQIRCTLNAQGTLLETLVLPDGRECACACALWTTPLMGRHPVLRESGIVLDPLGRIDFSDGGPSGPPVVLMGSGSAQPGAKLPFSGVALNAWPGGRESAEYSAWAAVDRVCGKSGGSALAGGGEPGIFAVREAELHAPDCPEKRLRLFRAGLSLAEAEARGIAAEYAIVGGEEPSGPGGGQLILCLTADRESRTLLGAQVLGTGSAALPADGVFGMALAALAGGTKLDRLARAYDGGVGSGLLRSAAAIICNKLDTLVKGITPDEFLASKAAGAEFFTLDLRSLPDWRSGHVPGACDIPLTQLKKRLQDEVPRFTPIVLVSSDGRDAYAVACRLAGLGATDLYVLDGGMRLWPYDLELG